jgi:hypothetical protein
MKAGSNIAIITFGNGVRKRYTNDSLFLIKSKKRSLIRQNMCKGIHLKKGGRKLFVLEAVNFTSS